MPSPLVSRLVENKGGRQKSPQISKMFAPAAQIKGFWVIYSVSRDLLARRRRRKMLYIAFSRLARRRRRFFGVFALISTQNNGFLKPNGKENPQNFGACGGLFP